MAENTSAELSGFASPIPRLADAGEGHGGDGHDRIGGQQENRADDGRAPRGLPRVLRLLIHRDRTVPAPVDEDRCQHCRGNHVWPKSSVNGLNQSNCGMQGVRLGGSRYTP